MSSHVAPGPALQSDPVLATRMDDAELNKQLLAPLWKRQFSLALVALLIALAAVARRNGLGRPPAPDLILPSWLRMRTLSEVSRQRARWALDGGLALIALSLALLSMTAAPQSAIQSPIAE